MTDDLIDTVRAALNEATPRPWWTQRTGTIEIHGGGTGPRQRVLPLASHNARSETNAHLIANAPEWLAALCDEVEALRAEFKEVTTAADTYYTEKLDRVTAVSDLARASAEVSAMQDLVAENERLRAELSNAERALPFCADSIEGECPRSDHWLREIKVLSVERDRWRKIADGLALALEVADGANPLIQTQTALDAYDAAKEEEGSD
jgi:hypothetical protein